MGTPTIIKGEEYFNTVIYEGNGKGQRVGLFVPFTDNGTIAKSILSNPADNPQLTYDISGETATSADKWTFSAWVKRSGLGTTQYFAGTSIDGNTETKLGFDNSNRAYFINMQGGSLVAQMISNRTFEDTSKWYHFVWSMDSTQSTAANRQRLYVDGDEITSWNTATYRTQNGDYTWTTGDQQRINWGATEDLDGYLAEINNVDGQQLGPDTFGVTDTSTGRWVPKSLGSITYGNTGYRLQFADSSAFGDDTSGNGHDFTSSNFASTDQTTDSPTQNFTTMSPARVYSTAQPTAEGNLQIIGNTGSGYPKMGAGKTIPQSGKWYWEQKLTAVGGVQGIQNPSYGVIDLNFLDVQGLSNANFQQTQGGMGGHMYGGFGFTGLLSTAAADFTIGSTTNATGDYMLFAFDMDEGKAWWGHYDASGTSTTWFANDGGTDGNPATGANPTVTFNSGDHRFLPVAEFFAPGSYSATYDFNFGQKSSALTAPSGFSSLSQNNFPETDKGITGLFWAKNRDDTDNNNLYDSSRGQHLLLKSNSTSSEDTKTNGLQKFLKGGAQVSNHKGVNTSSESYVAWNWVANKGTTASNSNGSITSTVQANTTAGFSIVQYTGTGSAATIGHGLSTAPTFIAVKNLDDTASWYVYMNVTRSANANTYYMRFDSDDSQSQTGAVWNDTTPTTTVFSVGGEDTSNKASTSFVAYCWTDVDAFSKIGSFSGNNNVNGPFIQTNFKPSFLMIKGLNIGNHWVILDSTRSTINPVQKALKPNLTQAEDDDANMAIDFVSNGFKIRGGPSGDGGNINGSYIYGYMAFAEAPFIGDGVSPVTAR